MEEENWEENFKEHRDTRPRGYFQSESSVGQSVTKLVSKLSIILGGVICSDRRTACKRKSECEGSGKKVPLPLAALSLTHTYSRSSLRLPQQESWLVGDQYPFTILIVPGSKHYDKQENLQVTEFKKKFCLVVWDQQIFLLGK